ncbi:MAG: hypothetical protein AABW83_01885 [Nanoarchaeota archaeon]
MEDNQIIVIIVIAVILLFFFGGFGMMGYGGYGSMMGNMMNWTYGGGFGTMMLFGLTIWILIVIALVLFIIWLARQLENTKKKR